MISIWKDDWQIYGQCFEVGESEALVRYIFKGKLPPKHPHLDPVFKAANNKVLKIEIICRKAWFNAYFLSQEIKKYE